MSKSLFLSVTLSLLAMNLFAGGIEKIIPPPANPNLHLGMMKDMPKYRNDRAGKGIAFGYVPFLTGDLNNYLDSTTSVHSTFNNTYMTLGIDNASNNGKHLDMISNLGIILPQTVTGGKADSLQLRLAGWHNTFSILGYDFVKGETVTLALGPAWAWGNLKMRRVVNGQKTKYTNPFVAPGARAEFRITIENVYFGARATYRYDLTHALWKRKSDMMPVMPEYKNSGMAYFGYLGLIF